MNDLIKTDPCTLKLDENSFIKILPIEKERYDNNINTSTVASIKFIYSWYSILGLIAISMLAAFC